MYYQSITILPTIIHIYLIHKQLNKADKKLQCAEANFICSKNRHNFHYKYFQYLANY